MTQLEEFRLKNQLLPNSNSFAPNGAFKYLYAQQIDLKQTHDPEKTKVNGYGQEFVDGIKYSLNQPSILDGVYNRSKQELGNLMQLRAWWEQTLCKGYGQKCVKWNVFEDHFAFYLETNIISLFEQDLKNEVEQY